jgi:Fe2+ or Zn2+ uptake regulation protein
MDDTVRSKQLYSEKLRAVFASIKNKPLTINEIISEVFKQKVSLWRPKKDVIRSLKILEIMGLIKKKLHSNGRIYEITDIMPYHELDIYSTSRCLQKMLEEFDISSSVILISDLKSAMKDFSDNEINIVLKLLEDKAQIKIERDKIYRK